MSHQTEDQLFPQASLSHLQWWLPETRRKAAERRAAAEIEWRNSSNVAAFEPAVKVCRRFVPAEKQRELAQLMAEFADRALFADSACGERKQ